MGRINRRRDRWTKRSLEFLLRPLYRRPRVDLETIRASRPQRILLVRQHNQMGDMLCSTPVFAAVKATFPEAETMLVTAPVNDGVVRNNPHLDHILLFDKIALRTSLRAARAFHRELRDFGADLAIVPVSVSFSGTSAALAMMSGARHIIGGDSRPFGWSFSDWLYSLVLDSSPELRGHAIDHGLAPLEAVGFELGSREPVLRPGAAAEAHAQEFLKTLPPGIPVAFHPGAGKVENQWPAGRFAAVALRVKAAGGSPWVVEGPADEPATAAMLAALPEAIPVLKNVPLRTVAAALAQSQLALVNDTGIMHVAGAMGIPSVALFGPTPADQWAPRGAKLVALQSRDGRMESLSEEEVLQALRPFAMAAGLSSL